MKSLPPASVLVLFACTLLITIAGCRGRAHDDLYAQRMASEIRILEDQLYEADYQNRVLRDKLERNQMYSRPVETEPDRASDAAPSPKPLSDAIDDGEDDILKDLELPSIDPGTSISPEALDAPEPDAKKGSRNKASAAERLPAPGGPEPPGASDLEPPAIIEGELLPPPRPDGEPEKPPGQIQLPDTAMILQRRSGYPDQLQIHPGLSGGHQFDEDPELDGLMVVVNVVDEHGETVDLNDFDVEAELTVVALDPTREPSQARIGRWEFSADQVGELVKVHPVSGLHIPIPWQDDQPAGEEVIVHVRLKADDEEMRCEQRLRTDKPAESKRIADWTPRGEKIESGVGNSILLR